MPEVSVIIPTFNRSSLLKETIASVLCQSLNDLEVIVVDDGSTDDTRLVVESITDKRIRYFYRENAGVSSARNFGLDKSGGEYVAFLDHDDFWPENFLEKLVDSLEKQKDFGAAYTAITKVHPDGKREKSYKADRCKSGWIAEELFKHGFIWTSASLFRKSALKGFRYDESLKRSYEDFDAYLRLSAKIKFLFVPSVEAFYRSSDESLSAVVGTTCAKILVLERFYFQLGGDEIVSEKTARRKISHVCRKVVEDHRRKQNRSAAVFLYKKAIGYCPGDLRLYWGLLKTLLLNKKKDKMPHWKMPQPLTKV